MLSSGLILAVAAALAPPAPAPLKVTRYEGLCEASAAVRLSGERFAMASDEADKLKGMEDKILIYRRGGGEPVDTATISEVRDLEAAAAIDERTIFWITSHSLNREGVDKPKRRELIATSIDGGSLVVAARVTDLRARIAALLDVAEQPLAVSLNVEGMAATTGGDLLLGLRAPLKDGKAGIVLIRDARAPTGLTTDPGRSPPAEPRTVWWLDLGGRGIRSLERAEAGAGAYLIVAGATGEAEIDSALFWWDGASETVTPGPVAGFTGLLPGKMGQPPRDMVPEAAIVWDDGTIEIFGDNEGGCSDEKDPANKRWFPSVTIPPAAIRP